MIKQNFSIVLKFKPRFFSINHFTEITVNKMLNKSMHENIDFGIKQKLDRALKWNQLVVQT